MIRKISISILALTFMAAFLSLAPVTSAEDGTILFDGKWTKKTKKVEGTWKIVEQEGKRFIELDKKFKTSKAPDLKIFLSSTKLKDINNKNAVKGSKKIAPLKSVKGAQRYEIPADVDLSKYKTVLIHCEKYTKLWGAATLSPPKK